MKLKNILIVVKDIEESRQFYHDLFGLNMLVDHDGNMILTEGLVLQDKAVWEKFTERTVIPENKMPKYAQKSKKFIIEKLIDRIPEGILHEQISEELFERDYTIYD